MEPSLSSLSSLLFFLAIMCAIGAIRMGSR